MPSRRTRVADCRGAVVGDDSRAHSESSGSLPVPVATPLAGRARATGTPPSQPGALARGSGWHVRHRAWGGSFKAVSLSGWPQWGPTGGRVKRIPDLPGIGGPSESPSPSPICRRSGIIPGPIPDFPWIGDHPHPRFPGHWQSHNFEEKNRLQKSQDPPICNLKPSGTQPSGAVHCFGPRSF